MKYTISCYGRSYEVNSAFEVDLDVIWASQRNFFLLGSTVTITDENGNSKTYTKNTIM